jgi:hypothetical protein
MFSPIPHLWTTTTHCLCKQLSDRYMENHSQYAISQGIVLSCNTSHWHHIEIMSWVVHTHNNLCIGILWSGHFVPTLGCTQHLLVTLAHRIVLMWSWNALLSHRNKSILFKALSSAAQKLRGAVACARDTHYESSGKKIKRHDAQPKTLWWLYLMGWSAVSWLIWNFRKILVSVIVYTYVIEKKNPTIYHLSYSTSISKANSFQVLINFTMSACAGEVFVHKSSFVA